MTHLQPFAVAQTSSSPAGCTAMPRGASPAPPSPITALACGAKLSLNSTDSGPGKTINRGGGRAGRAASAPGERGRGSTPWRRSQAPRGRPGSRPPPPGRTPRTPVPAPPPTCPPGAGSTPRTPPSRLPPPERRRRPWVSVVVARLGSQRGLELCDGSPRVEAKPNRALCRCCLSL